MFLGATKTQYEERQGLVDLLATDLVKGRDVAIDGGAHVGTWTEIFAQEFNFVHAFEPGPAFSFLEKNVGHTENVKLHNAALTEYPCRVQSYHRKRNGKLTSRRVKIISKGDIPGVPIDSLKLKSCSIIKLDIEGFEYPALMGAKETIERCRPFVLVELANNGKHAGYRDRDVLELMESFNYERVWKWNVDHGFYPR